MTTEDYQGHLGQGLVYEDTVPIAYVITPQPEPLTSSQQTRNLRMLRILWLLQDTGPEIPDEYSALEPVLLRMESKLDLVVELMGQVVSEAMNLPSPQAFKISSKQLTWQSPESVTVGTPVQVKCYLIQQLPLPLVINGEITSVDTASGETWLAISLDSLDEPSAEMLDKIIFRNHRRAIARQRQHS